MAARWIRAVGATAVLCAAIAGTASAQSGVELGADIGIGVLFGGGSTIFQTQTPTSLRAGFMWDPLESTCRHASLSIL